MTRSSYFFTDLRRVVKIGLLVVLAVTLSACDSPSSDQASAPANTSVPANLSVQDIALNNRGVALMGYFDYAGAREAFREAVDRQPGWHDVKVNLAIATLNRQLDGDEALAIQYLEQVVQDAPKNLRGRFVLALLKERAGEVVQAQALYEHILEHDPQDAYATYYLANIVQAEDQPRALALFERAIELDPYLRSAYYGAFLLNVRTGNRGRGLELQAIYDRLADNPRARLAETKYTRMGAKANALAINLPTSKRAPEPTGPLFSEPVDLLTLKHAGNRSLTTVDLQDDGLQDIFVADPAGEHVLVLAAEDEYQLNDSHALLQLYGSNAVAWGDIDNNGTTDMAACGERHISLWMQDISGGWSRSPALSPLTNGRPCADIALADADHDGDLDVLTVMKAGGNDILSNNGNLTFRSLRQEADLPVTSVPGQNLVIADLDTDRDLDLVMVNASGADNVVLNNDRLWRYHVDTSLPDLVKMPLRAITSADIDADGRVELYGMTRSGMLMRWSRDNTVEWSTTVLASVTDGDNGALDVGDFNGDGSRDLLVVDKTGLRILDLSTATPRLLFAFEGNIDATLQVISDADRGPSLFALVEQDGQQILRFWSPGAGRGSFATLAFAGKEQRADSMRSNRSGIGTRVAARRGSNWTVARQLDASSGRGQSLQPLAIGVSNSSSIDFIAVDWSDGVFQTELELAAGEAHAVSETQRQLSSCPVIFAWNGQEWGFVSDVLGVGGIGFLHAPNINGQTIYGKPRPWEYLQLNAEQLTPHDGLLKLKFTEPMEEIALLDEARLHVWDLSAGWQMLLDERMATGAPAVTGRPIFYRKEWLPKRVLRDDAVDLTSSVLMKDNQAADLGPAHPRFLGRLPRIRTVTLEFDQALESHDGKVWLRADGWVEYPYSQTVFAAWQVNEVYLPPTLEAADASGNWQVVHRQFGYPAGMPRSMALPLAALPKGTTKLRLRSNLEIYWDKLSVVIEEDPGDAVRASMRPLHEAEVKNNGFAQRIDHAQNRPDYDYAQRVPFWDTRYPRGHYTEYGPVEELVSQQDGAYAIIGPGEEVELSFVAGQPPPSGFTRTYALFVAGFAKDMDMYTQDSGTVGPLPSMPDANTSLHESLNTRYRDGY